MGRLVLFLIVIAAALAGVWFYAPGGKDMLLGAKSTVMGMIPGAEKAADDAGDTAEAVVEESVEIIEEAAETVEETSEEPSADTPQ